VGGLQPGFAKRVREATPEGLGSNEVELPPWTLRKGLSIGRSRSRRIGRAMFCIGRGNHAPTLLRSPPLSISPTPHIPQALRAGSAYTPSFALHPPPSALRPLHLPIHSLLSVFRFLFSSHASPCSFHLSRGA